MVKLTHQKGGIWVNFFAIFVLLCLRMASHLVGKCLKFDKISCRTFWYAILTTRWLWKVSVVKKSPKISEMVKKHPLFDGFLLPDRLPGLRYGLMGPRCDRLSKMSSTHSSGGGRGHIEASGASWVSHPDFTKGFYYITQKFHVHSSLQHQRHETPDSSHFFQSPPGKIRLGYFFWVRGGQLLYDVP